MTNYPLVSIVTVSYNSAETIKDTIESVLQQNYKNIEYIIIDGLSSDKTCDIISSYENHFLDRGISYKWISESDTGIYDAINKGIKLSKGDIVGIINSDDWYRENIIEEIVRIFSKRDSIDIVHGDIAKVTIDKQELGIMKPKPLAYLMDGMYLNHPSFFVSSNYYKNSELYDSSFSLASDYKFALSAYLNGANFFYLEEIIAFMRIDGATDNNFLKSWKESHLIRRELGINRVISFCKFFIGVIKRSVLRLLWKLKLKNRI